MEIPFSDIQARSFSHVKQTKCLFISPNKKYVLTAKWLALGKDICAQESFLSLFGSFLKPFIIHFLNLKIRANVSSYLSQNFKFQINITEYETMQRLQKVSHPSLIQQLNDLHGKPPSCEASLFQSFLSIRLTAIFSRTE